MLLTKAVTGLRNGPISASDLNLFRIEAFLWLHLRQDKMLWGPMNPDLVALQ